MLVVTREMLPRVDGATKYPSIETYHKYDVVIPFCESACI